MSSPCSLQSARREGSHSQVVFLTLLLGVWLTGCQAFGPMSGEPTLVPSNRHHAFQLKRTGPSAKLIVTRARDYLRAGCYYAVYINDTLAARMEPGERAEFHVPPGATRYGVAPDPNNRPICKTDDDSPDMQKVTLRAGEVRQLRMDVDSDGSATLHDGPKRTEVAEATAEPVAPAALPPKGQTIADFTPEGAIIERTIRGDLTGDGIADVVLVVRQSDHHNAKSSAPEGGEPAPAASRRILIGLQAEAHTGGASYAVLFQAPDLIPRRDSPALSDPLGPVQIDTELLSVSLNFRPKSGDGPSSETTFRFKLEDGKSAKKCMRLVSYEDVEINRATNATSGISISYLDGNVDTMKSRQGGKGGIKTQRVQMPRPPHLCIADVGNGWAFDPKASTGLQ